MPDIFKKLQIGEVVAYVQKTDSDADQEKPNVNPAIITEVHSDDSCDLFVMHSNGSYHLQRVKQGDERGSWHWLRLSTPANG